MRAVHRQNRFLRRLESRETLCRELMTASMLTPPCTLYGAPCVLFRQLYLCSPAPIREAVGFYVGLIAVHVLLFLIIGKIMPERVAGGKGGVFAVRFWRLMSMLLFIAKTDRATHTLHVYSAYASVSPARSGSDRSRPDRRGIPADVGGGARSGLPLLKTISNCSRICLISMTRLLRTS